MTLVLLLLLVLLMLAIAILVFVARRLPRAADAQHQLPDAVARTAERTEGILRQELALTRDTSLAEARADRQELQRLSHTLDGKLTQLRDAQVHALNGVRRDSDAATTKLRDELALVLAQFKTVVLDGVRDLGAHQHQRLEHVQTALRQLTAQTEARLETLTTSNAKQLEHVRGAVEHKLAAIQDDNAKQLEQMRVTVDEKLQGTLEKRLGESFQQVSTQLEQVHRGLGEVQSLATGVGDLKKVLGNVKTRGTWGEVQLRTLLSQILTSAQYEENVSPQNNGERVEFAVKMPGNGGPTEHIWLPIDAKFPVEDYCRLLDADDDGRQAARVKLAACVKLCAKDIADKYIAPPRTTNFAILFLPSEGLFAEVIRDDQLIDEIQRTHRVVIAGPTTLWAILTSLQMGFRTLAIQKRSSEIEMVLRAVKTEWSKYGAVLEKIHKKLQETSNAFDDAHQRNRAVGRKLRAVAELDGDEAHALLAQLPSADDEPAVAAR